eukprot:TRINITY_DN24328_c0_g1_i12.p2 TRINITY_DN24328_c0_g1~~TRINITY_DN24328_c0_g1_i12.p2  ORF type:complete len:113 (+),score=19.96 TRINITY_DN24328_c0_g1_i12:207-545(+)
MRRLTSARVIRETPLGEAAVSWTRVPELRVVVTVPAGAAASVRLPLLDSPGDSAGRGVYVDGDGCEMECGAGVEMCGGVRSEVRCMAQRDGESTIEFELGAGEFSFKLGVRP